MGPPSSLACTECRKHHLKCDAKRPSCSRCLDARLPCTYVPSRRGGRRKGPVDDPMPSEHANRLHRISLTPPNAPRNGLPALGSASGAPVEDPTLAMLDLPEIDTRLMRLFYENFHAGHPILLPSSLYEGRGYPDYLQQVVKFIGSHYSQRITGDILRQVTGDKLQSSGQRDVPMVQALLLYSTILFARGEITEAHASLSRSIDIALELGMYLEDFATIHSNGNEMEAESLRRTWWELFIVDTEAAALRSESGLRTHGVPFAVALPCAEVIYTARGPIPPPPTLAAFQKRVYCDDAEDNFSSFSYRIDAVRILARVLVLNSMAEPQRDHLQAVENALISWVNHLPLDKVDVVDAYGTVDEMLLHANTIIHYSAMLLHLPRSNLSPVPADTSAGIYPAIPVRLSPTFTRHVHSIKATEASKQLSDLLTVRPGFQQYSPFIIFKLVLCAIIQLATSQIHSADCSEHHSNRVILVLGCLKVLRRHWPIAQRAHEYVRRLASDAFSHGMELSYSTTGSSRNGSVSNPPVTQPPDGTWRIASIPGPAFPDSQRVPGLYSPGLLSAYVDPTCSDPFFANPSTEFDFT